jgi:hypothetical protein
VATAHFELHYDEIDPGVFVCRWHIDIPECGEVPNMGPWAALLESCLSGDCSDPESECLGDVTEFTFMISDGDGSVTGNCTAPPEPG